MGGWVSAYWDEYPPQAEITAINAKDKNLEELKRHFRVHMTLEPETMDLKEFLKTPVKTPANTTKKHKSRKNKKKVRKV